MAEILALRDIYKREGMQFVHRLLDDFVVISEKLNATRFCVERKKDGTLEFFKKDGKITKVDRVLSKLYEHPIQYFETLPTEVTKKLLVGYRYGFRYFHDLRPALIAYDNLPLNGLVLTDIKRLDGDQYIDDLSILNKISDLLRVEKPPVFWYGKLDGAQKANILEYLRTPEDQLEAKFKTLSFTKYIVSMLNPSIKKSVLKDDLEKPIDSVVFKFIKEGTKEVIYAKAIDPLVMQINRSADAEREPQDLFGIILSDIVEFIKINGLKKYAITEKDSDSKYLSLICLIFNDYISKMSYRYEGIEVNPLNFAKAPQFELNIEKIPNEKTKELLSDSSINRHIFKIMASSFMKPKKKPIGTVTQMLIDDTVEIAKKIKDRVYGDVTEVKESEFPTFEDFFRKKVESGWTIPD